MGVKIKATGESKLNDSPDVTIKIRSAKIFFKLGEK